MAPEALAEAEAQPNILGQLTRSVSNLFTGSNANKIVEVEPVPSADMEDATASPAAADVEAVSVEMSAAAPSPSQKEATARLEDAPPPVQLENSPPPVQLVFKNVSIEVPIKTSSGEKSTKRILDDVSGIFGPNECIAVMGPSGSGKTTMLNALTGVAKPSSGTVTVNGQPFDAGAMRRVSAFVPQDDLLTACLTVREALMEAALFKTGLSVAERETRVAQLCKQFDLEDCADVLIGHPEGKKGISGGQKRRLSVALELCGHPSLLYLDEPTSGLDAVSTMSLVRLMSKLASDGVTVIATIHQPVAFFETAGFPNPPLANPADYMFEVLVEHAATVRDLYESTGVPQDQGRKSDPSLPPLASGSADAYPTTMLTQLKAHVGRNFIALKRDPLLARLRVGSSVGVAIVMGILYFKMGNDMTAANDTISLLLFSMLFFAIVNALPVVISVLPELAVVHKEVRNNWYAPATYVPAKLVMETPLLVIPPLLYMTIMGNMTTLTWEAATSEGDALGSTDCGRFFLLYLAVLLCIIATHAWALFICSLAPSTEVAVLLAPGSIMPMALLSGFFKNQQDMTWIFRWFTYINYLNYAWKGMAIAGLTGKEFDVPAATGMSTGNDILDTRLRIHLIAGDGNYIGSYWGNMGILLVFVICFRILAIVMMLCLIVGVAVGHIPPSPQELEHLAKLQKAHASHLRRLEASGVSAPDYTCSDGVKSTADKWKVTGTSLGGWLVLEPWLTPSLFYQFLGADDRYGPDIERIKEKTGMDQKSFCTALGPAEANRQLRRHWKLWMKEEHIKGIAATGATHVRIPVGDWMWEPYGIYDQVEDGVRCNDGAIEELDRVLALCKKYRLGVLIDMHAWIGSQNGLDNSGETKFVKWALEAVAQGSYAPRGTFNHWQWKGWDWIINSTADWGQAMKLINQPHWDHSMRVITKVVAQYGSHPAIWGLSPVNEVGAWTPMDVLRKFFWEAYHIVRAGAPHWMYVMDSSFRGSELGRDDFMKGCPNKAMDKHPYHAWAPWGKIDTYYDRSCSWAEENLAVEEEVDLPLISGEWSLAMDTCAMWLLGFNDMQPGEPRAICDMVPCPCRGGDHGTMSSCYLSEPDSIVEHVSHQPGLPLDITDGLRGPFGSGISGPMFGRCPREMAMEEFEDEWITTLAHKQIASFNQGHGWFFWNFRTEFESHWDYLEAYRRGWFPRNVSDFEGLEKLNVCAPGAHPLKPTTTHFLNADNIYGGQVGTYWISRNWLSLSVGTVGGAALALVIMRLMKPKEGDASDYVAAPVR